MLPLEIHIPLKVKDQENIPLKLTDSTVIGLKITESGGGMLPVYTGEVTVIPKTFEQNLETENHSILSDITIQKIPYSQVSNPSGGLTVSIAFEG